MFAYSSPPALLRRRARLLAGCALAAALATPAPGQQAFQATPDVVAGGVEISQGESISGGLRDTVAIFSRQAVINWTPNDAATGGGAINVLPSGNELVFTADPGNVGGAYTVLNRIIPNDPSRPVQFDGHVLAQFDTGYGATTGGNVWFYAPGGIILGANSRFDVGSLVLSANNIDYANGLFGGGDTEAQFGTIQFNAALDSRASVTIQPGAQINAAGNYVAIVAPRISHAGNLNVEGGAALVAAESADITITVSGGLFAINVQTGSRVDAGGETTLVHSGATEVRDSAATGDQRRVYLMAVPKNDAVTMLVSGSLGYAPAAQAQFAANGAIVLSTANAVSDSSSNLADAGAIHVTGGDFRGRVVASGKAVQLDTSSAALSFSNDVQVLANAGTIAVSADARALTVGADLTLTQENERDGNSSTSVSATNGGTIQVRRLAISSEGRGIENGYGSGGAGAAGTIALAANGGIITASDYIDLDADGYGGRGDSGPGGVGQGGTITFDAANGGEISAANFIRGSADGWGGDTGYGGGDGGAGFGGSIKAQLSSGGLIDSAFVALSASGQGSFGDFGFAGGSGAGGEVRLKLDDARLRFDAFQAYADGHGRGSVAAGAGGVVEFLSLNGSDVSGAGGNFQLSAIGRSGNDFSGLSVADGRGGTVTLVSRDSSFALGEGSLFATADGIAGNSEAFAAVTGQGGIITAVSSTSASGKISTFQVNALELTADGYVGVPDEALRDSVRHGNSGTGAGGVAQFGTRGGLITANAISLSATGTGDNGDFGNQAGAGFGGHAELRVNGGSIDAASISIAAEAYGGDGAFGESGYGAGSGGAAGIGLNPLLSTPYAVDPGAYVTGTGGSLKTQSLTVSAKARGGIGGDGQTYSASLPGDAGRGGDALGGTALVSTTGVSHSIDNLSVSAIGIGGDGGTVDYSNTFEVAQTANAGGGGTGTGGSARIEIGGATQSLALVEARATGSGGFAGLALSAGEGGGFDSAATSGGGRGGDGVGGSASIVFTTASLSNEAELTAEADGRGRSGGSGPAGGAGGAGQAGSVLIRFDGGTANLYQISASATGFGGDGASGQYLDGGAGGNGVGGSVSFEAINGAVVALLDDDQFGPFQLDASAFGGDGGDGGSFAASGTGGSGGFGGGAFAGTVSVLSASGADMSMPVRFGSESPPSLAVIAEAGSGGYGGAGETAGGAGRDGGLAVAGLATIEASAGRSYLGDVFIDASARGGSAGFGGPDALSGSRGQAFGGRFTVKASDGAAAGLFTADDFSADLSGDSADGSLLIADGGSDLNGGIHVRSLYAVSFSNAENVFEHSTDYDIQSSARTIRVDEDATLTANGQIRFAFQGAGGLAAGSSLEVRSRTRGISVTNTSPANPLAASLAAPSLTLRTANGDIDAGAGTLLASTGGIEVRSSGGNVSIAHALASDGIEVSAGGRAKFTGRVQSAGTIDVLAGDDAVIASGAQLIADQGVTIETGDDIVIGSGALVRAANNAPPETGYGASDPLQQVSQLRLLAGSIESAEQVDGNVASILIDGTLEAPGRTIFMSAGAVQAGATTELTAGNLFVRLNNIPQGDQVPSSDGGQLSGVCQEGSVCLGTARVNGIVRIGESGYEPINLRLGGGIDAVDVLLRARSITLGQSGVAQAIKASDSLTIESLNETLTLNGPLTIAGGSNLARVASLRSITGAAAQLNAPATLDLYSGNNVTLGGISAGNIRTIAFGGEVLNGSGLTAPGSIAVGRIVTGANLALVAGRDIALDSFDAKGSATLNAAAGAISVATDAVASNGISATGKSVVLNGANGLIVTSASATAGDLELATKAGTLTVGTGSATGSATLSSGGAVGFASLSAGNALTVSGTGDVNGGAANASTIAIKTVGAFKASTLTASAGELSVSADNGVTLPTFTASGRATLSASNGAIRVDTDAIAASGITAAARSVSLQGQNGLNVTSAIATAGDLSLLSDGSPLRFGTAGATGDVTILGNGNISGDTVSGRTITVGATGSFAASSLNAGTGGLDISARDGITISSFVSSAGANLKSDFGSIVVSTDAQATGGIVATAKTVAGQSISLTSAHGLNITSATASSGVSLTTTARTIKFGALHTLLANGIVSMSSAGDISGDTVDGGRITVGTPGAFSATSLMTIGCCNGAIDVSAASGITASSIISTSGPVRLTANSGAVTVSADAQVAQGVTATGRSILLVGQHGLNVAAATATAGELSLTAASGDLNLTQGTATSGEIKLTSVNGGITLGRASGSTDLTAKTPGLLTIDGTVAANNIAFTSSDLAIGAGGQLTAADALTLTAKADRLFIGDGTAGTGYRLDAGEIARVASRGDITLASAPSSFTSTAFTFVDPSSANVVLGSLTFDGSQLGADKTLLITSPRSIGVTGVQQFKNILPGQTVTLHTTGDIALAAETGLTTLKNSNGGLSGTLRLEADQVHALSTKARSEIPGLDLNAIKQRLGTNDQLENNGGYFQAGLIVVRINRAALIQNSGVNGDDPNAKRGFTAGAFRIEQGATQPLQLVLNGQVGNATGQALIGAVTVPPGATNPGSSFNGCVAGAACGVVVAPPPPPPEPVLETVITLSSSRDQIEDDGDQDEQEEALQASQERPVPIIQFLGVPVSRFDPLIDQPVTGAGNEDFWERPASSPPTP